MTAPDTEPRTSAKSVIGEFKLAFGEQGPHYRVYADPECDAVSILRVYPNPETTKRQVATGLDSKRPSFKLPSNWSKSDIDKAESEIKHLWSRRPRTQ